MKHLFILIACSIISIGYLHAQNASHFPRYLYLSELAAHIGDSVCTYGKVRDIKVEGNNIFIDIDSAGFSLTHVLYQAPDSSTIKYLSGYIKNNAIIVYGNIAKENNRIFVKSGSIIPTPDSGPYSMLPTIKQLFDENRKPHKESGIKITDVVLLPPPPLGNSSKAYYTKLLNKKIDRCDNIARKTLSADGKTVELQMFGDMLFLLFEKHFWEKIRLPVSVDLTGKQLCFNGVLIRYKGAFAIRIKAMSQIKYIDK